MSDKKSTAIQGGKVFYSNNKDVLEGVSSGASFVNDGPYEISDVLNSDRPDFLWMLTIADPDSDDVDEEFL